MLKPFLLPRKTSGLLDKENVLSCVFDSTKWSSPTTETTDSL
jgi:hypothetical protein